MPMVCIICRSVQNFWHRFFVGLLDQPLFQISSSANLFRVLNYISSSSCNDGVKPSQCLPTYNKSFNNQKQRKDHISFLLWIILSLYRAKCNCSVNTCNSWIHIDCLYQKEKEKMIEEEKKYNDMFSHQRSLSHLWQLPTIVLICIPTQLQSKLKSKIAIRGEH